MRHVPVFFPQVKRFGSDKEWKIINLLQNIQLGWSPEYIDSATYYEYKNLDKIIQPLAQPCEIRAEMAFAGFVMSFAGAYFQGLARQQSKTLNPYWIQGVSSIKKLRAKIQDVNFTVSDYREVKLPEEPEKTIIYFDPPYRNTCRCNHKDFKYDELYTYIYRCQELGYHVFLSEYSAPSTFKEIWRKNIICFASNQYSVYTGEKRTAAMRKTERLYIYETT